MTRLGFRIISVFLLVTILLLPGCSSKNKDSQAKKPQDSSSQKTKAPTEMKSIITDIEKIIAGLEQKIKATSGSGLMQGTQKASDQAQQSKEQSQQSQKGQSQQSQQNQQGQSQSMQQGQQTQTGSAKQKPESDWQNEINSIKKIHQEWNKLEPESVKAGLSVSSRDSFESALDKLTLGISKQDKKASILAAIELYGQYANLVERFDTPVPSDFYRLKYEIMSASAEAGEKEWKTAQERIPRIKEYWSQVKVQAKVKDENLMNCTEFSLQDMENALKRQETELLLVKVEIVMKNLQELEKKLSSQKSTQS